MQEISHYPRVRPAVDIVETGAGVQIAVNMPGVHMGDIRLSAHETELSVRASSRCPLPRKDDRELRNLEFGNVEYALDISLVGLLSTAPSVVLHNGVLTLTFEMDPNERSKITLR